MLAEFSIIPLGSGSSIGNQLATVLRIVDESGIPYRVNPMGTVLEGEWDDIMALIKKCHDEIMKREDRAYLSITIDDRKDKPDRIAEKIAAVERRLRKTLSK